MPSLFERYRPARWDQVIAQEKAIAVLRRLKEFGGRAYWFAAASGTGKTTLARLIAAEMAESWHVDEIDAQDCTMEYLRSIEAAFAYKGMGEKTGKAWIVNEAHGLRGPILSRFLTLIERLPSHCAVMFTTTIVGQNSLFAEMDDASPLLSRCLRVPMQSHGLAKHVASALTVAFATDAQRIARLENMDGKPLPDYVRLVIECGHNMRATLCAIEAGAMLS